MFPYAESRHKKIDGILPYLKMDILISLLAIYCRLYSSELMFQPHSCCPIRSRVPRTQETELEWVLG